MCLYVSASVVYVLCYVLWCQFFCLFIYLVFIYYITPEQWICAISSGMNKVSIYLLYILLYTIMLTCFYETRSSLSAARQWPQNHPPTQKRTHCLCSHTCKNLHPIVVISLSEVLNCALTWKYSIFCVFPIGRKTGF